MVTLYHSILSFITQEEGLNSLFSAIGTRTIRTTAVANIVCCPVSSPMKAYKPKPKMIGAMVVHADDAMAPFLKIRRKTIEY